MSVDEAISSKSFLQLLEFIDKAVGTKSSTRKNERIATIALFHSLCPLGQICDADHTKSTLSRMIVMRDVRVDEETYKRIQPIGRKKSEFDLLFLNVPTIVGYPSKMNFYIEVEMGENTSPEMENMCRVRRYFEKIGSEIYPMLVCKQRKGWDDTFNIPILDIQDLERIVELIPVRSINDIPGVAYEWSSSALQILHHFAFQREAYYNKEINFRKGLWNACPNLRQHDFKKFFEEGKISVNDCEDFTQFRGRISTIFNKMVQKGLLKKDGGKCELTVDGRDILGCYLSFKER